MHVLYCIFIFAVIVQLLFWLIIVGKFNAYRKPIQMGMTSLEKVSLVIVLKNGAIYLPKLIKALQDQDYLNFEIVFVDDHSTDNSKEIIHKALKTDDRIKYFSVNQDKPGKKQALIEVMPEIKTPIVLLTDVDCLPASDHWISKMVSGFTKEKSIVIGYSPMVPEHGAVNMFSRYETFLTALQYFAWTLWGMPYMAVGRNLAYRRELFSKDIYIADLASGDDDLFMQAKANAENVAIMIDKETYVYTRSKSDFKSFFRQKQRHASSSSQYKVRDQIILSLFAGSHILYFLLGMYLLLFSHYLWPVSLFILLRHSVYYFKVRMSMHKLGEGGLVCRAFSLDLGLAIYYIILAFLMLAKKKKDWN